ncbi:agmatinase [Chitinivorax tropicus]|uniref:Agmatinase n=1 Tax=Chitinivorax tropicus TaxID=714531 RepID=A0A840MXM2_9PROT|nr:agmatinase [Chitinivorax tropicus]MBB5019901.1 agmatinase [Chitinivorax tropicus]
MDFDFPYLHRTGFMGAPLQDASRPFAIAGIPFDSAVTNRPGARFGPQAIRQASQMLCDGTHPWFGVSPLDHLTDLGDLSTPNTSLSDARAALQQAILPLLHQYHMVWLGGDHSITLSLLRAYRQHVGQPLALIHFDAHCDTWQNHFGEPSGHGTWTYEALQEGLVVPSATIQIGIRSAGEKAAIDHVNAVGGRVYTARALRGQESETQLAPMLDDIRQRILAAGNPPTYLTLDIDCLDPAFAPGTGTPEPGGLTTNQVLSVLEALVDLPLVGMDCVEVCPPYDHASLTANAAAVFVWTYLCQRLAARAR